MIPKIKGSSGSRPGSAGTRRTSRREAPTGDGFELRAHGLRLTKPRRAVLDVVRASFAHPSAGTVYESVRHKLPRVSLATVYRNLRTLAAEGFLRELPAASGMRFDGRMDPHDHFTCLVCHLIYDVPPLPPSAVLRRVRSLIGFEVLQQRIEFYGRCRTCRRGSKTARSSSRAR
jgi:Fur family transcriptional regulator, peroxide stress response regulator